MRTLRFCFDVISHNAYLAWVRLPEVRERFGLAIEPVPVLFAGLLEANGQLGPAEIRPKAQWMVRNNLRKAALLGVELKPPVHHPFNPLLALRIASLDLPQAQHEALITGLFRATWSEQRHVSDPGVVTEIAREAGLEDPADCVARTQAPEIKARLREQTDAAIARGVFGVPSFEVDDELFWGYDDLPYLERYLAGEDPLDAEAAAIWSQGAPRPSSMRRRFREDAPPSWQREAAERSKDR